jgi:hypothetical protein
MSSWDDTAGAPVGQSAAGRHYADQLGAWLRINPCFPFSRGGGRATARLGCRRQPATEALPDNPVDCNHGVTLAISTAGRS